MTTDPALPETADEEVETVRDPRDQWNTEAVSDLRGFLYEISCSGQYPPGILSQPGEDQRVFFIDVNAIYSPLYEGDPRKFYTLVATYYKNRQRTDGLWLVSDDGEPPKAADDQDIARVLDHYRKQDTDDGKTIDGECSEVKPTKALTAE